MIREDTLIKGYIPRSVYDFRCYVKDTITFLSKRIPNENAPFCALVKLMFNIVIATKA